MNHLKPGDIKTAEQLIEAIRQLWNAQSIGKLRDWLAQLETEDDYYRLIRLADQADLYTYSNFLSTQAYQRFGTLRSLSWHCGRLMDTGKSLEAEAQMRRHLQRAADSTDEELTAAHHLLLRVFSELNRLPEAKEQLDRIEEIKGFVYPDQEGYYYVHSGEWTLAEKILKEGLTAGRQDRSYYTRLLYADFLSMNGRHGEALQVLQDGEKMDPDNPSFRMEQIRRLFYLDRYEETLKLIEQVDKANPFHARHVLHMHFTAECLYKLERWEELADHLQRHQDQLKKTVYGKSAGNRLGAVKQLELTPKIQKLNYCVPASLSMMLETYGMAVDQDEIASHIFDVTGSKLRTTMAYMESLGFTARYFKGTVEVYKKLIDAGVPALLSIMIENSSHVQVMLGYDDRLQALIIQDPNDLEPFLLPYSKVPSAFKLTDSLSMVFLTKEQTPLLSLFEEKEDRFFRELYAYLDEESEEGESAAFLSFLNRHLNERYAAVVGLTSLFSEQAQQLHDVWLKRLQQELGEKDAEVALLAAHTNFQKDKFQEALYCLEHVDVRNSPYALFLKGVIHMQREQHAKAIPLLKRSIELDHYQPAAYSHLARCYLESGEVYQAYKWSSIALEQMPSDSFVQITHALIQFESGAYHKALKRFQKLAEEQPDDGYFIYEIGRCLQQLSDEEAIAAYRRSIELEPSQPYPYLRIAEIHMAEEAWQEAEKVVAEGIIKSENKDVLYMYRGHIWSEQKEYSRAEAAYRQAFELDPDDLFAVTHIIHVLMKQDRFEEAQEWLSRFAETGDAGYFIRTASMLWEEVPNFAGKEQAITLLERGMELEASEELPALVEQYAAFGEDPLFRPRVLKKFKELNETRTEAILLCYEAALHEQYENYGYARRLYEQAAAKEEMPFAYFRLGLMGEQREDYAEAAANFLRCVELDPDNMAAHEGLFRIYSATGKTQEAFSSALHILENEPLKIDAEKLFEVAGDGFSRILQVLDRIIEQVPEDWLLLMQAAVAEKKGDIEQAEDLIIQATEAGDALPVRLQLARFYLRNGEAKRSLTLLESLIVKDPEEEGLFGLYIEVLAELRKTAEINKRLKKMLSGEKLAIAETYCADQLAEKVEGMDEEEPSGLVGKLRHKSRKLFMIGNVIALYEDAMKKWPKSEVPVMRLAGFYFSRGLPKDAAGVLEPFIKKTDNYEAARFLLYVTMSIAEEDESMKYFHSAVEQARRLHDQLPFDAEVLLILGDAYAALGEIEQSLEQYEHVIHLEPFSKEGYVRAMQLLAEQSPEEAEGYAARIPDELQDDEWLVLACAVMYITVGKAREARNILIGLTEKKSEFLPAYYELARSEMLLGQTAAAKEHLLYLFNTEEGEVYWLTALEEELFEPLSEELTEQNQHTV